MQELDFNRMIYAIVSGLYEKEQNTDKYPYSNHLQYGINILAAMAFQQNQLNILNNLHEASFITEFASKPVKEWFEGWNDVFIDEISKYSLYNIGSLIKFYDKYNFIITDDCESLYGNSENDLFNALEQNQIYRMMKELDSEQYTSVRKFIVQNPVCTESMLKQFKILHHNPDITEIISTAYEDIPENSYRCPICGWTMSFNGIQSICCNQSCTKANPSPEQLDKIDTAKYIRLKHGVMRYICQPGKLELEIQEKAEKYGHTTELWPEKDKYDIKIIFDDGKIWAIDAKTHSNPYALADSIKNDNSFERVVADKILYVIPKERLEYYSDYCDICNNALKGKKAECITDTELYKMIRRKKKNGSD